MSLLVNTSFFASLDDVMLASLFRSRCMSDPNEAAAEVAVSAGLAPDQVRVFASELGPPANIRMTSFKRP